jgi:hypothetical protein
MHTFSPLKYNIAAKEIWGEEVELNDQVRCPKPPEML